MLVCDNDHTASKTHACQPDGSWKKTTDYDAWFTFGAIARECPDLQALAALIEDIRRMATPSSCAVSLTTLAVALVKRRTLEIVSTKSPAARITKATASRRT